MNSPGILLVDYDRQGRRSGIKIPAVRKGILVMEMKDIYRAARERLKGACRVCPVCNGRACAGEMPGIGGIGTGSSFMANFDSLARIKLNLRTIHEASAPDLTYDFFGRRLKMPVLVAPLVDVRVGRRIGHCLSPQPLRRHLAPVVLHVRDFTADEIRRFVANWCLAVESALVLLCSWTCSTISVGVIRPLSSVLRRNGWTFWEEICCG